LATYVDELRVVAEMLPTQSDSMVASADSRESHSDGRERMEAIHAAAALLRRNTVA